jgi:hypothetical protein
VCFIKFELFERATAKQELLPKPILFELFQQSWELAAQFKIKNSLARGLVFLLIRFFVCGLATRSLYLFRLGERSLYWGAPQIQQDGQSGHKK